MDETKIVIFKNEEIRKTIYYNQWWFSVVDVILALTDSFNPRDYWFKMKIRVKDEDGIELSTICRQLKLKASDRKMRITDCANTEGIFRIIQSIPSPKEKYIITHLLIFNNPNYFSIILIWKQQLYNAAAKRNRK